MAIISLDRVRSSFGVSMICTWPRLVCPPPLPVIPCAVATAGNDGRSLRNQLQDRRLELREHGVGRLDSGSRREFGIHRHLTLICLR